MRSFRPRVPKTSAWHERECEREHEQCRPPEEIDRVRLRGAVGASAPATGGSLIDVDENEDKVWWQDWAGNRLLNTQTRQAQRSRTYYPPVHQESPRPRSASQSLLFSRYPSSACRAIPYSTIPYPAPAASMLTLNLTLAQPSLQPHQAHTFFIWTLLQVRLCFRLPSHQPSAISHQPSTFTLQQR
jgi:hypothetical protein